MNLRLKTLCCLAALGVSLAAYARSGADGPDNPDSPDNPGAPALAAEPEEAPALGAGEPAWAAADTTAAASVAAAVAAAADTTAVASVAAAVAAADTTAVVAAPERMSVNERRNGRGLVEANNTFVPRGQWIFGGYASYSTHTNENYTFFIFENIGSDGYTFKVSPMISYAVKDNMAFGARFIYGRTLLKVNSGELNLGDEESGTHIAADFYYSLRHSYSLAGIWRQYIPLGSNKRFALFNEMSLTFGGHQAKFAANEPVRGTYETGYTLSLGISPGLIVFATNSMAVEINVGVMGINFESTRQEQNRVEEALVRMSSMNFNINLLSVGLGVSFYL